MKKLRLLLILSFIILGLFSFASCDDTEMLNTPEELFVENTTLQLNWKKVSDARLYTISITKENQTETKLKPNENVNVNVNENDNVNVNVNSKEQEEKDENELPSKNLFDTFESEFARPLSPIEYQTIASFSESFSDELVIAALKESIKNGVRSLKYVETILSNWRSSGVQTVDEAYRQIERFKNKKNTSNERKIPEWCNEKEKDLKPASEESIKEFETLLARLEG